VTDLDPCLAVIPARGGSKGLPGKNIRMLGGIPLLAHSIRCAELIPRLARTVVSTDSDEIAAVARAHRGDVPFIRPAHLASDEAAMMPVLAHAVQAVEAEEGRSFGSVLLLDPTSPGRLPEDVDAAFDLLSADSSADAVLACSTPTFNPFWVGVVEQDGYLEAAFAGADDFVRRQDVPRFMRINGALYLYRRAAVEAPAGAQLRRIGLEISELRAFAIDDEAEFATAEALLAAGLLRLPWLVR
jgi:N-acylneuraminate cytidylyltransferase